MLMALRLRVHSTELAICQLHPASAIPRWAAEASPLHLSRTSAELSIVCPAESVPSSVRQEAGWRAIEVEGPLDFGLTGILHSITSPLAENGITIFAVSTYHTDYVLVKCEDLTRAVSVLDAAGHLFA